MLFDPEGPQNYGSLGEMPPMMPLVEPPKLEPVLAKARARIDATNLAADYVWAVGNPADKIAATARDRDARMVVLAASHHGFFVEPVRSASTLRWSASSAPAASSSSTEPAAAALGQAARAALTR